jgi:outer membrane protein assembly factor BamA
VKSGLGVQYLFQGTNFLRFYYENSLSILQSVDTTLIRQTKSIPATNPVTVRSYGVDFLLERVDYNFNPRQGFKLRSKVGVGNKTIERDSRIEDVLFANSEGKLYDAYDSLDLKIFTGKLEYMFAYFQPIGEKMVFVPMIQGKHIVSDKIFFDELFRIGGNGDLRGFDERSLQASSYHIYQLEYRYLIGQNSFFSTFFNGAYYQNFSEGKRKEDTPFGFGIGLNLEVKTGILQLAYALGKEQGNPIQFSQSKIHFGIVSFI